MALPFVFNRSVLRSNPGPAGSLLQCDRSRFSPVCSRTASEIRFLSSGYGIVDLDEGDFRVFFPEIRECLSYQFIPSFQTVHCPLRSSTVTSVTEWLNSYPMVNERVNERVNGPRTDNAEGAFSWTGNPNFAFVSDF